MISKSTWWAYGLWLRLRSNVSRDERGAVEAAFMAAGLILVALVVLAAIKFAVDVQADHIKNPPTP